MHTIGEEDNSEVRRAQIQSIFQEVPVNPYKTVSISSENQVNSA